MVAVSLGQSEGWQRRGRAGQRSSRHPGPDLGDGMGGDAFIKKENLGPGLNRRTWATGSVLDQGFELLGEPGQGGKDRSGMWQSLPGCHNSVSVERTAEASAGPQCDRRMGKELMNVFSSIHGACIVLQTLSQEPQLQLQRNAKGLLDAELGQTGLGGWNERAS